MIYTHILIFHLIADAVESFLNWNDDADSNYEDSLLLSGCWVISSAFPQVCFDSELLRLVVLVLNNRENVKHAWKYEGIYGYIYFHT